MPHRRRCQQELEVAFVVPVLICTTAPNPCLQPLAFIFTYICDCSTENSLFRPIPVPTWLPHFPLHDFISARNHHIHVLLLLCGMAFEPALPYISTTSSPILLRGTINSGKTRGAAQICRVLFIMETRK
ncbi:hypothetical protein EGR_05214 [Echinococcus granulosus]|uniref:Uncharacterized protein n=1 Tax=Echinococcus granulosus TaxID=6210 RepID=W6UFK1_ECHGR|nr:hypothetical protein EGR_05214 [Echinococcus granulosus]EUB59888.1 hypothetical protein EGR_05214 [Echinococcus granulosus]